MSLCVQTTMDPDHELCDRADLLQHSAFSMPCDGEQLAEIASLLTQC